MSEETIMNELLRKKLEELKLDEGSTSAIAELVAGMVEAETEKGKEFYRKKDGEAKGLREINKKLGYDSEKYSTVDEYLSTREKETSQKDITLESLKDVLEGMKTELQGEKDLRTGEYNERVRANAQTKLTEKLTPQIYGSKGAIFKLLHNAEMSMDGDNVTIGGMSVDDVVADYVKNNPDDLKANQEGGSGDRQNQADMGAKDWQTMTLAEASKQ